MEQVNQVLRIYDHGHNKLSYVVGPAIRSDMEQRTAALWYVAEDSEGKLYAARTGYDLYQDMELEQSVDLYKETEEDVKKALDYVLTEHFKLLSDTTNKDTYQINQSAGGLVLSVSGRRIPKVVSDSRDQWQNFELLNGKVTASEFIRIDALTQKQRDHRYSAPVSYLASWPSQAAISELNALSNGWWDFLINGLSSRANFEHLRCARKVIAIGRTDHLVSMDTFDYAVFIPGSLPDGLKYNWFITFDDQGNVYGGNSIEELCGRITNHDKAIKQDIVPWLISMPVSDILAVREIDTYPQHRTILGSVAVLAGALPKIERSSKDHLINVTLLDRRLTIKSFDGHREYKTDIMVPCSAPIQTLFAPTKTSGVEG